jgi:hypothetical protein
LALRDRQPMGNGLNTLGNKIIQLDGGTEGSEDQFKKILMSLSGSGRKSLAVRRRSCARFCVFSSVRLRERLGQEVERENVTEVAEREQTVAKQFWGRHLWACGYFAASSGNVTDEVIMEYIAMQDIAERARDDDFTISP